MATISSISNGKKDSEVFAGAKWLSPAQLTDAKNVTGEFRTYFNAAENGSAELFIAADTVYAVELNGIPLIQTARLPDVPPARLYDVWSLDGIIQGNNELLIRLYYQGVGSYQYLPGKGGVLFALKAPDVRVLSGKGTEWRISTSDRADGVPWVTGQLGFSFEYDSVAKPDTWRSLIPDEMTLGAEDIQLKRRPVAPSVTLSAVKSKIIAEGILDGSQPPADIAQGMDATPMSPCELGPSVDSRHFDKGFYYLVDLGREEAGLLDLELDTDAGVTIDIGHAEHSENGRIQAFVGGRRFAGRYHAKAGLQSFTRWQRRMAGRFLQLHVRGVKTHFVLKRASVKPVIREIEERPVPSALDERRAAIWRTAVRTLRLSMHEHYEDCPWREQALYANDTRNQILCGRFAFADDSAFAAQALGLFAKGMREDGWLEMCMPAKIPLTIPSFTFSWTLALADCVRLYGPLPVFAELLPTAKTILERCLSELEDGLLPCPRHPEAWHFYDWADNLDNWGVRLTAGETRFDAPLNMLLLMSLEADANVAETYGDAAIAARWRNAATSLRARIREFFWNADSRCFDTYRGAHVPGNGHELTQSLAILADVVSEDELDALATKLSSPSDWVETTLSQSLHKFEALAKVGPSFGRKALMMMDATWGAMLDAGATSFWEMKEGWTAFDNAGSMCHGWSAVPVYFYAMHLCGANKI